nr:MAG TPA: replisome organizer [Caudoviricetes sp.]
MRIRSIKPEFWRSLDIAALTIEDRLLFIGLWSYVDDNGVGVDRVPVIAAELFADDLSRDPRETLSRVSEGIGRLSEQGLVQRYSDGSKDYLSITNWERHQRIDKPNKPRYPLPTSENVEIRETLATHSRDIRETPAPGTGEQGNRGAGEQGKNTCSSDDELGGSNQANEPEPVNSYPQAFEDWWNLYPRKQGKRKALNEWRRATKRVSRDELNSKTQRFADFHNHEGTDKQFIPLPTTWLNRDGWDDELIPRTSTSTSSGPETKSKSQRYIELGERMARELEAQEAQKPQPTGTKQLEPPF